MKFLVIQTAFIGDVILVTGVLEKLNRFYPGTQIDLLVRKGNESLFHQHPFLHEVIVFDKKDNRLKSMLRIVGRIRKTQYDVVVNAHRFFSSGLITVLSGARKTIGFDKNPVSMLYSERVPHEISVSGKLHEVQRDLQLITSVTDDDLSTKPRLYPPELSFKTGKPYVCMAPASIWFTKQWPEEKWTELVQLLAGRYTVYLLGSNQDKELCRRIAGNINNAHVVNKAGELSLLESAALMKGAVMNFVNDSAPMHLASSVDAPVTAIYCSTVPAFGFGPLSTVSRIMETEQTLDCRPCGLHGYKSCPKGHFNCAEIDIEDVAGVLLQERKV